MNEKLKMEQSRVIPEVPAPRMPVAPAAPQPVPVVQPAEEAAPMQIQPSVQLQVAGSMSFEMTYPLIYYRAMPYIFMACDEMELRGTMNPSQEETDEMTDRICDDMVKAYPDLANAAGTQEMDEEDESVPAQLYGNYYRDYDDRRDYDRYDRYGYYRRPRRRRQRNNFGDIVNILLLSELLRRRRRY